jgi:RNA-binding protein
LIVIGSVLHTIGERLLVVECDAARLPKLYSEVIDRRMRPVGKIMDVFGNVSTPYAAVLCKGACGTKVGEKLFIK